MGKTSIDDARRVKVRAAEVAGRWATIAGVGLTKVDGGYAVKINLAKQPSAAAKLPTSIDGVPVIYEVVGRISARRAS